MLLESVPQFSFQCIDDSRIDRQIRGLRKRMHAPCELSRAFFQRVFDDVALAASHLSFLSLAWRTRVLLGASRTSTRAAASGLDYISDRAEQSKRAHGPTTDRLGRKGNCM